MHMFFYLFALLLAAAPSALQAQHSPHDFPHRMGGMPGMTEQTLQETTRRIHEEHAHDRKIENPAVELVFGRPGAPDQVRQTVHLELSDRLRISPGSFAVRRGETVRIVVNNPGTLKHRLLIGDSSYQHEHSLMRQVMPAAEHGGVNALAVGPGQTGELLWTFDGPDDVDIVCHSPGHYEAGMVARVHVAPTR